MPFPKAKLERVDKKLKKELKEIIKRLKNDIESLDFPNDFQQDYYICTWSIINWARPKVSFYPELLDYIHLTHYWEVLNETRDLQHSLMETFSIKHSLLDHFGFLIDGSITEYPRTPKVRHQKLVLLLNIVFHWVRPRDTNLNVASFAGFTSPEENKKIV